MTEVIARVHFNERRVAVNLQINPNERFGCHQFSVVVFFYASFNDY